VSDLTFLSLGANVGDALETLTAAVYALDDLDGVAVEEVSGVYETAPWPPPDDPRHVPQDPYLNLVVRARTSLEPHVLLTETQLLETAFGRDRAREQRWGPRPLDIDLLLVGGRQVDAPELALPHPRLTERAFVLVPLMEVWPGGTLPDGRRVTQALAALAPIEGIELVVRLEDVPGRHLSRPEGPGSGAATFAPPGFAPDEAGGAG
jgi:2-amino-4-hydroxy-6-hydroxymethyldihydropteridine diphosphokinase